MLLTHRLQLSVYITALFLFLRAHSLHHPTTSTHDITVPHILVREESQQPNNASQPEIDPLVTALLVKTYDTLGFASFQPETIFRDGQLIGNWKQCGKDGVQFKDCHVISPYREQMSIEYSFNRDRLDEYTLHEPSIENRTTAATAELVDFSFRDDLRFTIKFHCIKKPHSTSLEVFDLTIPVLKNYSITTRFTKNCTSGVHPYVRLGTTENGSPHLLPLPLQPISASPTTLTTDLLLRVLPPAETQVYGVPVLESSNDGIKLALRGISDKGSLVQGEDLKFSVMYECAVNGVSNVTLVIPLPPWEDIRLNINKKCGGRIPETLSIGTSDGSNDVMHMGIVSPRFAVLDRNESRMNTFMVAEESATAKIYLQNAGDGNDETLHLGKIHFTVSASDTLAVMGKNYADTAISTLKPGEVVTEEIRFICRQKGLVYVVVSIPILQYEVVDFVMGKQCREPMSYKESGIESWWTVDGMEHIAFIVGALLLVLWCLRARGKERGWFVNVFKGRGYRAVAMTDES